MMEYYIGYDDNNKFVVLFTTGNVRLALIMSRQLEGRKKKPMKIKKKA